jgi:hypothetical protein
MIVLTSAAAVFTIGLGAYFLTDFVLRRFF